VDLLYGDSPSDRMRDAYTTHSRIEARLERGTDPAQQKQLVRKKVRTRLVLAPESDLTDDTLLKDFLAGYDRERFTLLFGFDHETLREGGESLMRSGGHAGISLFEAGSGIQHLQNLLTDLSKRSQNLVDPKMRANSSRALNQALRAFVAAETAKRQESLRGEDWHAVRDAIRHLEISLSTLTVTQQQKSEEVRRVERAIRVSFPLAQLHDLCEQLARLDASSVLPASVEGRVPEITAALTSLETVDRQASVDRDRFQEQLQSIVLDSPVIEQGEAILALHERVQQFETYRDREQPELEEQRRQAQSELRALLADLAPDLTLADAEMLRIPVGDREEITHLLRALPPTEAARTDSDERLATIALDQQEIDRKLETLSASLDPTQLAHVLHRIRALGDVNQQLKSLSRSQRSKRSQLEKILKRQTAFLGSVDDLVVMTVPLRATVTQYQDAWQDLQRRRDEVRSQREQTTVRLGAIREELARLELGGSIPIAAELDAMRRHRDQGWTIIKQAWRDGVSNHPGLAEFTHGQALDRAYEAAVAQSDNAADRMWQDGAGVAHRQALVNDEADSVASLATLEQQLRDLDGEAAEVDARWQAEWRPSGMLPKTPPEMKEFLDSVYSPIIEGHEELEELSAQQTLLQRESAEAIAQLDQVMPILQPSAESLDSDLSARLAQAETYLEAIRQRASERQALLAQGEIIARSLADAQVTRAQVQTRWATLHGAWNAFLRVYSFLPPGPDAALAYLQRLGTLFQGLLEVENYTARLHRIQSAMDQFLTQLGILTTALNQPRPDLESASIVVRGLQRRLEQGRLAQETYARIDRDALEQRERQQEIQDHIAALHAELQVYLGQYAMIDVEALTARIRASLAYKAASKAVQDQVAIVLQTAGDARSLDALEQETLQLTEAAGTDGLTSVLAALNAEIEDLDSDRSEVQRQLIEKRIAFQSLNNDATLAADYAQEAEAQLTEIDRLWNEYLRVELARRLLEQAIDQFRGDHESTILHRAGQFLTELTLGRYQGLVVQYLDDQPRLQAVRQNDVPLFVQDLSDGTRDQLFLSLRLAFLELHATDSEPLPLIMDDILVHFDDERTRATLRILAELGQHMQILYFTHHQAVVEASLGLPTWLPIHRHALPSP